MNERRTKALADTVRMVEELRQHRDQERDPELRGSYQAAIDRLDALAYRLRVANEKRATRTGDIVVHRR